MSQDKKQVRIRRSEKLFPYTRTNTILFVSGFLLVAAGYAALTVKPWNSFTSLTVAPILLVLGYCVVIPAAILAHKRDPEKGRKPQDGPAGD